MKAEDTVIQFDETKLTPYSQGFLKGALRDQAEITWNAREPEIVKARLAGIKKMVEWIKSHQLIEPDKNSLTRFKPFYQIEQSKLKEWGVSDEPKT